MGTSVAAFVGLAPGGPMNTPLRVSRWGQFARVYGDPNEPDNGPFMEGAFLAHAVHGFFQNGGTLCWVVRVGGSTPRELGGDVAERSGLGGLAAIDEVTMVCMPDAMALAGGGDEAELTALQGKLIAHCENAGNRMAILDCPPRLSPREVLDWRTSGLGHDSRDAALYYPWLEVADPLTGRPLLVPPSGHVAGVWCRTDAGYGVHRAPTEGVVGAAGLGFDVAETDQAELDEAGVNSIRAFPGQGIRVWGARTLSSDPEWRYVPCAGSSSTWPPRSTKAHAGRSSSRTTNGYGRAARTGGALSRPQLARRRAGWRNRERRVLRQVRRGDQPSRGHRGRPGRLRDRHRAGQAAGVRRLRLSRIRPLLVLHENPRHLRPA